MIRRLPVLLFSVAMCCGKLATAQLNINNAQFTIESGATVTVQGDLTSNTNILGAGKILLKGSTNQNVNMNGNTIPNLEMDNGANATLTGNARIGTSLAFTNGKILLGTNNLTLSDVATTTGGGTSKFVETNGTGKLNKEMTANLTNYVMPVGTGTAYSPLALTSSATYAAAVAGVQAIAGAAPAKHPRSTDFLNRYWTITRTGITGTLTATGTYNDPTDVTGVETDLVGMFYNGTTWTRTSTPVNTTTNMTSIADVPATGGSLYAMNKFNLLSAKAFLQGAFNGTDMTDGLRTGTNVIPVSDPYRTGTYTSNFTHVNNSVVETVAPSVFADQATTGNNIVDWVFIELRNTTTGGAGGNVLQTRAALIQRDGDIVDVDGVSTVYFKNVDPGNYTIAVRHRNHLAMATDPATNSRALSEQTPSTVTDFTTFTASQIFGGAAAYALNGTKNLLWAGNANHNTNVRYSGAAADRATILSDLLNVESNVSLAGYYRSDVNMNKIVRYSGAQADRAFILATVLANNEITLRTQALPQ